MGWVYAASIEGGGPEEGFTHTNGKEWLRCKAYSGTQLLQHCKDLGCLLQAGVLALKLLALAALPKQIKYSMSLLCMCSHVCGWVSVTEQATDVGWSCSCEDHVSPDSEDMGFLTAPAFLVDVPCIGTEIVSSCNLIDMTVTGMAFGGGLVTNR